VQTLVGSAGVVTKPGQMMRRPAGTLQSGPLASFKERKRALRQLTAGAGAGWA